MLRTRVLFWCLWCAFAAPVSAQTTPVSPPDTPLSRISNSTQWRLEQISADHVRLTGQVEIEIGPEVKFFADEIDVFTDPDLRFVASGNVVFSNPEGRIAAEHAEYNVTEGTGTFHLATGSISLGATVNQAQFANQDPDVYFYGETIEKISPRSYRVTRGGFTTCVQPTPRWEVVSDSVVINLNDYAVARNIVLRVKGVPLMYLPVIYYPIQDDDRATGFLMPTYGTSTLRGQAISNAFFWALGQSHDATFFHDWFTQAGQGFGSEYRYVAGQRSSGNFRLYRFQQAEAEFGQAGRVTTLPAKTSYQFTGYGTQGLGAAVRAHQRLDYTSDIVTQQLYQQNIYQASNATRTLESGLSAVWGPLATSVLYQRTETFANVQDSTVYGATPRVNGAIAPQRILGWPIYGSLNAEYAFLPNQTRHDGETIADTSLARWDVLPSVRIPLSRLSFLTVNTSGAYRTTYYSRSVGADGRLEEASLLRRYFTMRSDIIGPVFARIWDTPGRRGTERMKHVIEPTFSIDQVTAIDNYQRVSITTDPTDFIVGGGRRLTYGLVNRLFLRARADAGVRGATREFMTVGVQQTLYSKPEMSQYNNVYASAFRGRRLTALSPVALTVRVNPAAALNANARLEYDVSGDGLQIVTTGVSASVARHTTSVSYSRRQLFRTAKGESALGGSTTLNFLDRRATGTYALNWDISRNTLLSQSVVAAYMAQCCGVQVEFQRFKFPETNPSFPISSDRRFNVSFVLAGLGTFSNFFGAFGGLAGTGR